MSNQDLAELPIAEKLRMMESLWDSLLHEAQGNQAVPEWHKDVLSERASRLDSGVEVSSPGVVRTALVDDARWAEVDALDVLVFETATLSCRDLLGRLLSDTALRAQSVATSRSCDPETLDRVLGRVTTGRRSFLVVAAHLASQCTATGREEVDQPGSVLAAGCEEIDVVAGTNHRVDVELFPWRDP